MLKVNLVISVPNRIVKILGEKKVKEELQAFMEEEGMEFLGEAAEDEEEFREERR